jgi:hypothetical protein
MKIKIKNARLSYPHLFNPASFVGDDDDSRKRFGANLLIEVGSADDKAIQKVIKELAVEKLGKKADAQLKAWRGNNAKYCYTDGETKDPEQFEGMMILSANRGEDQGPPVVVDRDPTVRLTSKDGKPYSGCYVNATVDIWIQSSKYSGIRCTLIAVQFSKDGEAFGGAPARVDDDDFEDLSDTGEDEEFEEPEEDFEDEFEEEEEEAPAPKRKR